MKTKMKKFILLSAIILALLSSCTIKIYSYGPMVYPPYGMPYRSVVLRTYIFDEEPLPVYEFFAPGIYWIYPR